MCNGLVVTALVSRNLLSYYTLRRILHTSRHTLGKFKENMVLLKGPYYMIIVASYPIANLHAIIKAEWAVLPAHNLLGLYGY